MCYNLEILETFDEAIHFVTDDIVNIKEFNLDIVTNAINIQPYTSGSKYRLLILGYCFYNLEVYTDNTHDIVFAYNMETLTSIKNSTEVKYLNGVYRVKLQASRYIILKYSGSGSYWPSAF